MDRRTYFTDHVHNTNILSSGCIIFYRLQILHFPYAEAVEHLNLTSLVLLSYVVL